jgi:hypothetical protein
LRPARITFAVLNVDAFVPDRDGFDVSGLLLGKHLNAAGTWYVFAVGIVARRGYRPSSIADIRVAAMSPRDASPLWKTGAADAHALHRYRRAASAAVPLRFPADIDRFSMSPCPAGICVQEQRSGAQWTIALEGATARTARRSGTPD